MSINLAVSQKFSDILCDAVQDDPHATILLKSLSENWQGTPAEFEAVLDAHPALEEAWYSGDVHNRVRCALVWCFPLVIGAPEPKPDRVPDHIVAELNDNWWFVSTVLGFNHA
jgi:hypothetical protein